MEEEAPRRLYRSNNGMIAGGMRRYCGLHLVGTRRWYVSGYILLSIFTVFSGVIAYLILWIVIPKKDYTNNEF